MGLLNLHTHHPTRAPGFVEIESVYLGQIKAPAADWYSVGLHPWYVQGLDSAAAGQWLRVEAARADVLAVGEAGLDKVTTTPWVDQLAAFRLCVEVSEEAGKPLIIHCVRAFSEILAEKKRVRPRQPWIFHGYAKAEKTAEQLLHEGCYLSFGAALLSKGHPAQTALKHCPPDRFFFETDDQAISIREIYHQAAVLLNLPEQAVKQQVWSNFQQVFAVDSAIFAAKTVRP